MKKILILFHFIPLTILLALASPVLAAWPEADGAAILRSHFVTEDPRLTKLSAYLSAQHSPLAPYAGHFIYEADKNDIDWTLVAAIAGVESTFGKHIPPSSFNGWGWGIPTGTQSGLSFDSWKEGITKVSEGLRKNYMDKGAKTIEQIGSIYAASPTWAPHVHFFVDQIQAYTPNRSALIEIAI